jgi:hypothetical protein
VNAQSASKRAECSARRAWNLTVALEERLAAKEKEIDVLRAKLESISSIVREHSTALETLRN